MNPIGRLTDVPDAARKVANVAEVLDVRADAVLLAALEEAVAENRALHARLEVIVAELEQTLVPLLEKAVEGGPTRTGARAASRRRERS